jgi:DUF4097 and DUF4098 domain-containing protein YvlB
MKRLLAAIGILAVVAASCSAAAPTFEEEFSGVTGIVLDNGDGSVSVVGAARDGVLVTGEASFSDTDQFDVRVEDGLLIVEHDCGDESSCTVDYQLTIPEGTGIQITTDGGNVSVSDVKAGVAVTTATGDAFVRRIEGEIVVGTVSGLITGTQNRSRVASFTSEENGISVSFDEVIDTLRTETGEGDITVQLTGGPYALDTETGSGSVDVNIDVDENAVQRVAIRTGKGDIKVFQN